MSTSESRIDDCPEQSRQFGFLRFAAVEDAETFMDRNYPVLYLYGDSNKASNDPDECKVKISYGRERKENKSEEGDWNCSAVGFFDFKEVQAHFCSVISTTSLREPGASDVKHPEQVRIDSITVDMMLTSQIGDLQAVHRKPRISATTMLRRRTSHLNSCSSVD